MEARIIILSVSERTDGDVKDSVNSEGRIDEGPRLPHVDGSP
jgi:hypothetical protein